MLFTNQSSSGFVSFCLWLVMGKPYLGLKLLEE